MTNNSATGGYLDPTNAPLPGNLSFEDFLQLVLIGITGIDGTLVRPRWQIEPPQQPAQTVDWLSFGTSLVEVKGEAYVIQQGDGGSALQQQETVDIECSFYGPNCVLNAGELRDGFQISQNRESLLLAGMGYKGASSIRRFPELVNEKWNDRADITITIVREVDRTYQVLYFVEAIGEIITDNDPQIIVAWDSDNVT